MRALIYAFSSPSSPSLNKHPELQPGVGFDFGTAQYIEKDKNNIGSAGVSNTSSGAIASEHQTLPSYGQACPERRRVLILGGHDGVGAFAVQLLSRRGWRVSVHAPFPNASLPASLSLGSGSIPDSDDPIEVYISAIQARVTDWGGEEVIFDDGGGAIVLANDSSTINGTVDGSLEGDSSAEGAVVRMLDGLRREGEIFDAILDTVGGKRVWEASERLLRLNGCPASPKLDAQERRRHGVGQFITVVGDNPSRVIPTAGDHFRAGLRSWRIGSGSKSGRSGGVSTASSPNVSQYQHTVTGESEDDVLSPLPTSLPSSPSSHPFSLVRNGSSTRSLTDREKERDKGNHGYSIKHGKVTEGKAQGKVGYAWVCISQDIDWEGDDIRETLGSVLRLALHGGIKPFLGRTIKSASNNKLSTCSTSAGPPLLSGHPPEALHRVEEIIEGKRVIPFEQTPNLFVEGGPLTCGPTPVVVRIVQ